MKRAVLLATGGGVTLRLGRAESRVGWRFAADHLRSSNSRIGMACAGLIMPGTCFAEQLSDDTRSTIGTGGMTYRLLGNQQVAFGLAADATLARVQADTRGLVSRRELAASKMLWGGLVGLEASWTPVSAWPLAIELGGAWGGLTPVSRDQVVDGYIPFEDSFSVTHARLGVTWRP